MQISCNYFLTNRLDLLEDGKVRIGAFTIEPFADALNLAKAPLTSPASLLIGSQPIKPKSGLLISDLPPCHFLIDAKGDLLFVQRLNSQANYLPIKLVKEGYKDVNSESIIVLVECLPSKGKDLLPEIKWSTESHLSASKLIHEISAKTKSNLVFEAEISETASTSQISSLLYLKDVAAAAKDGVPFILLQTILKMEIKAKA